MDTSEARTEKQTSPRHLSYLEQLQAAARGDGDLHVIERKSTGEIVATHMARPDGGPDLLGITLNALLESAWQTYPDGVRYGGVVTPEAAEALITQYRLLHEGMPG
jgi:hypothetical protein